MQNILQKHKNILKTFAKFAETFANLILKFQNFVCQIGQIHHPHLQKFPGDLQISLNICKALFFRPNNHNKSLNNGWNQYSNNSHNNNRSLGG